MELSYTPETFKGIEFFDAAGNPRVAYHKKPDGSYDLFKIGQGHHPKYGVPLQPVTPEVVMAMESHLERMAKATLPRPTEVATAKPTAVVTLPPVSPTVARETATAAPPTLRDVEIPAATVIRVELEAPIVTQTAEAGQQFEGELAEPAVADGLIVSRKGSRVWGRITLVRDAPRKGKPQIAVAAGLGLVHFGGQDWTSVAVEV